MPEPRNGELVGAVAEAVGQLLDGDARTAGVRGGRRCRVAFHSRITAMTRMSRSAVRWSVPRALWRPGSFTSRSAPRQVVEDLLQHVVAGLAVGQGLVVQADAVQDHVLGQGVQVFGDDVAAAVDQRPARGPP